jgi:hypothetical protein
VDDAKRRGAGADGRDERQRTIDTLCEAFANDELEVEEFERRVAAAHRATSGDELHRLLIGLPTASVPAPIEKGQPGERTADGAPLPAPTNAHAPTPFRGEVSPWGLSVGIMGGTSRTGYWVPAQRNVAVAIMGGCELDLREASLPPGVTEIYVVAFWGGVEIVVPPWLRVESSGMGIMGGFEHRHDVPTTAPPGGPLLRVNGLALMGGVEVSVRYPGESAGDARKRVKAERKAKRLAARRTRDGEEESA